VHRAAGREAEARRLLEEAAAIHRAKGDVVGAAAVEAVLAELEAALPVQALGRPPLTTG
jgi:hypothetical protein